MDSHRLLTRSPRLPEIPRAARVGIIVVLYALMIAMIMATTGCAALLDASEKSAKRIGEGVDWYCENTSEDIREHFRDRVNFHAQPNSVEVFCDDGMTLRSGPMESGY